MQKGVDGAMCGALIETEARRLRDEAMAEKTKEIALRMLKRGKLIIEGIAEISELSVEEVKQLAEPQTV